MRAIAFDAFGGPEVLHPIEWPEPLPGPGEVVVRVAGAAVNPTDLLMRSGQQAALMTALVPPYIAGMEFSGHVLRAGEGVSGLAPGQAVLGVVNPRRPAGGSHTQCVCVPAASLAPLGASADLYAAATVPMNGLTAVASLALLGLKSGQSLLVTGGAGVLARYVIQLARLEGLVVLADAKAADADEVRALGASEVLPRGEGVMEAAVGARFPRGVDGLVDTALLGNRAAALVRDGGGAVAVRRTNPLTDPRLSCHVVSVIEHLADTAALRRLAVLFEGGELKAKVARVMPMAEAAAAHQLTGQGGLRGRIVLDFAGAA